MVTMDTGVRRGVGLLHPSAPVASSQQVGWKVREPTLRIPRLLPSVRPISSGKRNTLSSKLLTQPRGFAEHEMGKGRKEILRGLTERKRDSGEDNQLHLDGRGAGGRVWGTRGAGEWSET